MYIRNIPCCSIIRTNHFSEPPLVLISSDNRRSTVVPTNSVHFLQETSQILPASMRSAKRQVSATITVKSLFERHLY